jgi:hypothetical protein
MAKESMINRAAGAQPKSGHHGPAGKSSGSMVGNETKANTRGAGLSNSSSVVGTTSLSGAMKSLKADHTSGVNHMPLHGMKSGGAK